MAQENFRSYGKPPVLKKLFDFAGIYGIIGADGFQWCELKVS
jgi:hypothetical protein